MGQQASTMVIKTETCRFSGLRIYPGRAVKFVRTDTQIFTFLKSKCRTLFNQRKRPAKLAWTSLYRKQHKKDATSETTKRKKGHSLSCHRGSLPRSHPEEAFREA